MYGTGVWKPFWNQGLLGGLGDVDLGIIDPQFFFPDPQATDQQLTDAEYVIVEYHRTARYIKEVYGKSKRVYDETDMEPYITRASSAQALGSGGLDYEYHGDMMGVISEHEQGRRCRLWECAYDGGERIATAVGSKDSHEIIADRPHPKQYLDVDWNFDHVILSYVEEPHRVFGHGLPEQTGSANKAYNNLKAQILESAKYAANSFFTGVDTEELKLLKEKGYRVAMVGDGINQFVGFSNEKDANAFKEHGGHPMVSDGVFLALNTCRAELDQVTQIYEETQGKRPAGISSGKALQVLQAAASSRPRMFNRQLTEALIATGRRIMSICQLHYDTDRLVRMENDAGYAWDIINSDKLMGHFDLEVALRSRLVLDPREEAEVALKLGEMGKMADIDLLKFLRVPDPEGVLQRAQEELVQKMQLEMAMQAQVQGPQGGGGAPQ